MTRQRLAAAIEDGAAPILKGYRAYVLRDRTLDKDDKRHRLTLVRELESLVRKAKA